MVSELSNSNSDGGKGSLRWQAPELILETRFNPALKGVTKSTDVFAFARVCLEVKSVLFSTRCLMAYECE